MIEDPLDDIVEARKQREQAQEALEDTRAHRETAEPVWNRMKFRRVENSFGEEYEMSLVRVGRAS